jgi:two-component system, sensor histidine kinase YesM
MFNPISNVVIYNSNSTIEKVEKIIGLLSETSLSHSGSTTVEVDDTKYMVNYVKEEKLGWIVMDYTPLDSALKPILKTKRIYYISCFIIFSVSIVFCYFMFRKV